MYALIRASRQPVAAKIVSVLCRLAIIARLLPPPLLPLDDSGSSVDTENQLLRVLCSFRPPSLQKFPTERMMSIPPVSSGSNTPDGDRNTPAPASTTTPAPTPSNNTTITLQVGERRFVTRPGTLTGGSDFFATQLSGRWPDVQQDGSYFIDADGGVFEHVLRYLRHETMPIFYDNGKGHEYTLYLAVLEQARYFGVEPLRKWLEEQKYLQAVKIVHSARLLEGIEDMSGSTGSHVKIEHHVTWRTKKVYVCPRAIVMHMGNPNACGRLCRNAQGDADDEYEDEEVLKVLEVRKIITLDPKMCVEQR